MRQFFTDGVFSEICLIKVVPVLAGQQRTPYLCVLRVEGVRLPCPLAAALIINVFLASAWATSLNLSPSIVFKH